MHYGFCNDCIVLCHNIPKILPYKYLHIIVITFVQLINYYWEIWKHKVFVHYGWLGGAINCIYVSIDVIGSWVTVGGSQYMAQVLLFHWFDP